MSAPWSIRFKQRTHIRSTSSSSCLFCPQLFVLRSKRPLHLVLSCSLHNRSLLVGNSVSLQARSPIAHLFGIISVHLWTNLHVRCNDNTLSWKKTIRTRRLLHYIHCTQYIKGTSDYHLPLKRDYFAPHYWFTLSQGRAYSIPKEGVLVRIPFDVTRIAQNTRPQTSLLLLCVYSSQK
jgi:hypothetical protein